MRIIAGEHKGRSIQAVPGDSTRPTADRIREAWASSIGSAFPNGFQGITALDAFAGSGALGLEALSRGAAKVVFCDSQRKAISTLRANIQSLTLAPERTELYLCDIFTARSASLLQNSAPFDLIILDPPYDYPVRRIQNLMVSLASAGFLKNDAIISYEHREGENRGLAETPDTQQDSDTGFQLLSERSYGKIVIEYFAYH